MSLGGLRAACAPERAHLELDCARLERNKIGREIGRESDEWIDT